MRTLCAVGMLCGALAAASAFGADTVPACPNDPGTAGMHARMKVMREQMDQIEWTTDRVEQRRLMQMHMKHMHEGLRELRNRDLGMGCRIEMMNTMMEAMVRHEQVMHDNDGH